MHFILMKLCHHIWRLLSRLFCLEAHPVDHNNVEVPPTQDTCTESESKARVAYTQFCKDKRCSVTRSRHLVIENREVPLEEDQATAISYTWGEFNRQKVLIGHTGDGRKQPIKIELGEEWTVRDVIARLAELSSSGPIWLDQLCIVQNDEAVRKSLAKIPAIFRTFPVVVLMPDHPCKQLGKIVQKSRVRGTDGLADSYPDDEGIFEDIKGHLECLTFTASSSWFRRLWTRQELMYSRSIRCVWASDTAPDCVWRESFHKIDSAHLPRYLALKLKSLLEQGFSSYDASMKLLIQQRTIARYGQHEMSTYLLDATENGGVPASRFYDFLSGELLKSSSRPKATVPIVAMSQFMRNIDMITQSFGGDMVTRTSTHLQDYVLAVWPDCPNYVVPEKAGTHELHCLMQDALDQISVNQPFFILTTAPQGLFDGASQGSALWHPDYYHRLLQSVKGQSEISFRDVYGPLYPKRTFSFSPFTKMVPITVSDDKKLPISSTARDYHAYIAEMTNKYGKHGAKSIVIEQMKPIILEWSGRFPSAVNNYLHAEMPNMMFGCKSRHSGESPQEVWTSKILPLVLMAKLANRDHLARAVNHEYDGLFEKEPWFVEDITKVIYKMVAMALRLNEDICQKSGVRIMLSGGETQTMQLGFYRGDVGLSSLGSEAEGRGGIKSVRMDLLMSEEEGSDQGPLIYEAVPESRPKASGVLESHRHHYKVFGVWVPLQEKTQGGQRYNAKNLTMVYGGMKGGQVN